MFKILREYRVLLNVLINVSTLGLIASASSLYLRVEEGLFLEEKLSHYGQLGISIKKIIYFLANTELVIIWMLLIGMSYLMRYFLNHALKKVSMSNKFEKSTIKLKVNEAKGTRKEQKIAKQQLAFIEEKKEFYADMEFKAKYTKNLISNIILELIKPYDNIRASIRTLKNHNLFFYLLLIVLGTLLFSYSSDIFSHKQALLDSVMDKGVNVSFGVILGIILYHSTPILFLASIAIYAITQINKNLRVIELFRKEKQNIDILKSTLFAKAEVGMTDEEVIKEIKVLANTLQDNALNTIIKQEKNNEFSENKKSTYREKLLEKSINNFLKQITKIK